MMSGRVYFDSLETHVFDAQGRWLKSWFFCESCGRAFETKREALKCCSANYVVNNRYNVCMRCGSVFINVDAFQDHRARGCVKAVNEGKNTRELYTCLSCGATLTSRASLESHLSWHELRTGNPRLRFVSEALIGEGQAVCDRCGAVVGLEEIKSIFHDQRGLKIDLCRRCFRGI
jgi:ribosomal protein L40E